MSSKPPSDEQLNNVDWSLTTWEGSRCETLRRWSELPLERVIAALEEMQELSEMLAQSPADPHATRNW